MVTLGSGRGMSGSCGTMATDQTRSLLRWKGTALAANKRSRRRTSRSGRLDWQDSRQHNHNRQQQHRHHHHQQQSNGLRVMEVRKLSPVKANVVGAQHSTGQQTAAAVCIYLERPCRAAFIMSWRRRAQSNLNLPLFLISLLVRPYRVA